MRIDPAERLFDCSLVKLAEDRFVCYLVIDHIITDLRSEAMLIKTLSDYYQLSVQGRLDDAEMLPEYQDYVEYERKYLSTGEYQNDELYWKEKLSRSFDLVHFYRTGSSSDTTASRRVSVDIGPDRSRAIQQLALRTGLMSPAVAFATVLFVFLNRLTGARALRVGASFANRPETFKDTVGLFFNICPIQVEIASGDTFIKLARRLQLEIIKTAKRQKYPVRNAANDRLYNVNFTYQNSSLPNFCEMQTDFELLYSNHSIYSFAMQVRDFKASGQFVMDLDFNCADFDHDHRSRSIDHLLNIFDSFIADENLSLHHVRMLSGREEETLLLEFNRTRRDYDESLRLNDLFEWWVSNTPERVAVGFDDQTFTYAELNDCAGRIARRLRSFGVGPETLVAVVAERGIDLLSAMLGIFKAGGVYVPVDPVLPPRRLAQVLDQSDTLVVLAAAGWLAHVNVALEEMESGPRPRTAVIEELLRPGTTGEDPPVFYSPRNLAYVIFTSGSTGAPKGAMVEHRGMLNHLRAKIGDLELGQDDIVLQTASQSFDISVWQFLAPLLVGGKVIILGREDAQDPSALLKTVELERVTLIEIVPSLLRAMLEGMSYSGTGRLELESLKWMMVTGEAAKGEYCRQWLEHFPHTRVVNAYGPTECSDDVTHHFVAEPPPADELYLPIGKALANCRLYIVDRELRPVPAGIAGELLAGGAGVGRGYVNAAQRTAEAFVPDHLGPESGARLYRTGDVARYQAGGVIEFLGRMDQQVKVRGYRIELGEIEAILAQHSNVRDAAVVALDDKAGRKRLVAYVVSDGDRDETTKEIREYLQERLPEYMTPSAFVVMKALPLTQNGKINRQELPAPDLSTGAEFVEPGSPIEELLADLFAEVLEVERVGVTDDFFALGGHSLLATQLIAKLHQIMPINLPLRRIFEAPTVRGLSEIVLEIAGELGEKEMQELADTLQRLDT
jgi:amino acid adenylation domain-containing protein